MIQNRGISGKGKREALSQDEIIPLDRLLHEIHHSCDRAPCGSHLEARLWTAVPPSQASLPLRPCTAVDKLQSPPWVNCCPSVNARRIASTPSINMAVP